MDADITITGNVVREPQLLKSANDSIYTRNSVAIDTQRPDGNGGWIKNPTTFMDITLFDDLAKHFVASCSKGTRITVEGRLQQRTVTGDDGQNRSFYSLVGSEVGISLKWVTVDKITKRMGSGATKLKLKASKAPAATSTKTSGSKKSKGKAKSKQSKDLAPF